MSDYVTRWLKIEVTERAGFVVATSVVALAILPGAELDSADFKVRVQLMETPDGR